MSIAIITGASSGIGAEFARGLSDSVDELWLVARRREKMEKLGEEINKKYKVIVADLSTEEGINSLKEEIKREKPSVKFLVNGAGFGDFGGFDELSEEVIVKMIDLNVKALVTITHFVVPYMERGGRIIQLGSGSCFTPLPYFNVYASTKSFVLHYTKALNYEIKKYGVRATCFCPGWVATEFIGKATADSGVTRPRDDAFRPLLDCKKVVKGCITASKRGRSMYVTGWFTKLQHVLFKLVPDGILTRTWMGMIDKKGDFQKR